MSLKESWRRVAAGLLVGASVLYLPDDAEARRGGIRARPAPQARPAQVLSQQALPYAARDTIVMEGKRLVSFPYVLRTGTVAARPGADQFFDWKADDAFMKSYRALRASVRTAVETSPALSGLLAQPSWSRADRVTWEREVSGIVSAEMDKVVGLGDYRISESVTDDYKGIVAKQRATRLNDLARDMEKGTTDIEFDCETMAAIEGCLLQETENHFLPANANGAGGGWKAAAPYFYVNGWSNWFSQSRKMGAHAYIVSSATGNVIEATADPSQGNGPPYREAADPAFSFRAFVESRITLYQSHAVYGGYAAFDQVIKLRYDRLLPQAKAQTALSDDNLRAWAADPGHAGMLSLLKDVSAKGFAAVPDDRLKQVLETPEQAEIWDRILGEQAALLGAWSDLVDKCDDDKMFMALVQKDFAAALEKSPWKDLLPSRADALAPVAFEWRLRLAVARTEGLWERIGSFAAAPHGAEIAALMGKEAPSAEDRAALAAILARPDVAPGWEALRRDNAAMVKAWQDAHDASHGDPAFLSRVHEELGALMARMPAAAGTIPRNEAGVPAGPHIEDWTGRYLRGLEKFLKKNGAGTEADAGAGQKLSQAPPLAAYPVLAA